MEKENYRSEWEARFGEESSVFGLSYRNRLFKLDLVTMTWIKLKATSDILPRPQCFGAELRSEGETMNLVIGGGYGLISAIGKAEEKMNNEFIGPFRDSSRNVDRATTPVTSYEVYYVEIDSGVGIPFIQRCQIGSGWE